MRFLRIDDDATVDDIREAITNLRAKQRRCGIQSTRDEIDADVNELLDVLALKVDA